VMCRQWTYLLIHSKICLLLQKKEYYFDFIPCDRTTA
jgi:hypothetical protein